MASHEKVSEYKMDHRQRGLALIFNQENFQPKTTKKLKTRRGTDKDRDKLIERFQELGFRVEHHDDSNAEKMMDKLHKAAKAYDHSDADCFVCVFLSHGEDGHIWARDDKVNIKEITNLFRGDACKKLVGKPKIFIFQACRGKDEENAVTPMVGEDDDTTTEAEEDAAIYTLPAGADFLMCYCAAGGFVSFRHPINGSFYIQDLCETLKEQGSTLEFTKLLTLVNFKVSKHTTDENKKQMPCFTSMLTKELYFRPK